MFAEAFNQTLDNFKITARDVAYKSGVREATVSDYRNGKIDAKISTVEALIQALPQEAKNYMLFKAFMTRLSDQDISLLLYAIAQELRKPAAISNEDPRLEIALR